MGTVAKEDQHVYQNVDLKSLPSFSTLNEKVQKIVSASTWWDLYGVDWAYIIASIFVFMPVGLVLLGNDSVMLQVTGLFLLGCYQGITSNRGGHMAAHCALARSEGWNRFWCRAFIDFNGGFSAKVARDIHVKCHHPHTNIIGLGDSSTWKFPFLPCAVYMFVAPLLFPVITPLVGILRVVKARDWIDLVKFSTVVTTGAAFHVALLMTVSGMTLAKALACLLVFRAVLAIPYIHVNIFQHIGLPMFSPKDRPVRIYQMSVGCLNLYRNPFLDLTFGHTLINCHVEHHLFPRLSDNMCIKIKPLVRQYLLDNGLPYNEKSYWDRLVLFVKDYNSLMVDAPPITHFVGIQ